MSDLNYIQYNDYILFRCIDCNKLTEWDNLYGNKVDINFRCSSCLVNEFYNNKNENQKKKKKFMVNLKYKNNFIICPYLKFYEEKKNKILNLNYIPKSTNEAMKIDYFKESEKDIWLFLTELSYKCRNLSLLDSNILKRLTNLFFI